MEGSGPVCHSSDTVVWVGSASRPSHTRGPIGGMCAFLTGGVCIWRLRGEASKSLGLHCPVSSVCCIGVSEGAYVYMAHLRAIDGKRTVGPAAAWPDIQGWSQIMTPMVASEWERLLASHPDDAYSAYLVRGLRDGFRIGFGYGSARCRSAVSNMQSDPGINIAAGHRPKSDHFHELADHFRFRSAITSDHI